MAKKKNKKVEETTPEFDTTEIQKSLYKLVVFNNIFSS